jgi:putative aminopeptidase FrvX
MLLAHADGWFQAAADNGGGAAAALRAAELLAGRDPGVGVVVAVVDGEEIGLLGSKGLAEALASPAGLAVPQRDIALHMAELSAVMNLDASTARASDVQDPVHGVTGTDAPVFSWRTMVFSEHATLPGLFLETFSEHGVLGMPVPSQAAVAINGGWRTDAGWFHAAGVPVAWPAVGYPEYHTDADSLRAVDRADLEHVAEAAAALVPRLAGLPRTPILQ